MSRNKRIIVNVIALQVGWFACVLGAAWSWPFAGPIVVALLLAVHLSLTPGRWSEVKFVLVATVVGTAADSLQVTAGTLRFEEPLLLGTLVPIWMIALWLNFATAVNVSLRFLRGRYVLASALGAVGGANAYYGGVSIGALAFPRGSGLGAFLIGLEWALMMPVFLWIASRMDKTE